ncbi:SanA/YdcF family protein [Nocardiopsis xinjiangensis]|uniref:SanA/YdcF family protein n=1 Tax=Nocardiopsis xinjiangensis TaxID=124285 RepID=UPI000526FE01|nr:ElyC/SanA/YdcF family protein [Nocardiopsis xinjiangensis]
MTDPEPSARRPARARLLLCTAAAVCAAVAVLCVLAFTRQLYTTAEYRHTVADVPDRSVAVVLGAGVRSDGLPSRMLSHRLDMAVELYGEGSVEVVLVSGDNGEEHYNETDTMAAYLVDAGVPEEHVVGDHAGFSTWDTCARAAEVFGVQEAAVVSQDFHVPRAVELCRAAGIDAVGVGESLFDERGTATVHGWVREVPAALDAAVTTWSAPDPTLLGERETGVDDALADR